MLSFAEACCLIADRVTTLPARMHSIDEAEGLVLAEEIVSEIDVCPYRNSAMDGFAVKAEWLRNCSSDKPVRLPIVSTLFAGDPALEATEQKAVQKIMTGAVVGDSFDAVVRFEDAKYDDQFAEFTRPIERGANVRDTGEDVVAGQLMFGLGATLRAVDLGILASVGRTQVSAYPKPTVAIASTGNELIAPGQPLGPGQLYNSNQTTIKSLIRNLVSDISETEVTTDDPDSIRRLFETDREVIITSGGVSAGERDLIPAIAEQCGFDPLFHKLCIKPGKPIYFAMRNNQYLMGLPGNPLSTAVTCALFCIPLLKLLAGRADAFPSPRSALMAPDSRRKSSRYYIWPGTLTEGAPLPTVAYSAKRSSAALSALLGSDGLILQSEPEAGQDDQAVKILTWQQILH